MPPRCLLITLLAAGAWPALASAAPASAAPDRKVLATFAPKMKTTFKWWEQNDPVMGGQSFGNFSVQSGTASDYHGVFQGETKVVPFLKAPGFCRATTGSIFLEDTSAYLKGGLELSVRARGNYTAFKLAFTAIGVPLHHGGHEALGQFKSTFTAPTSAGFKTVYVPFNSFSWDWSDFTGLCSTKDPDGYQHKCCSDDASKCPTAKQLSTMDGFSIWAEGIAGPFHLEVESITAVMGPSSSAGNATKSGCCSPCQETTCHGAPCC